MRANLRPIKKKQICITAAERRIILTEYYLSQGDVEGLSFNLLTFSALLALLSPHRTENMPCEVILSSEQIVIKWMQSCT